MILLAVPPMPEVPSDPLAVPPSLWDGAEGHSTQRRTGFPEPHVPALPRVEGAGFQQRPICEHTGAWDAGERDYGE